MKQFKQYLIENNRDKSPGIVFTFGRFNPPFTSGHYENFKFLQKYGKQNKMDAIVYTSSTQDNEKNPMDFNNKVKYLRLGMPKGVQVSNDSTLKNAFKILEDLIKNKKYQRISFVVGEDRFVDFDALKKYAQQWGDETGIFVDFNLVSSGNRKKGVSGTQVRKYVQQGDFESFVKVLSPSLRKYAKDIFELTRQGLM